MVKKNLLVKINEQFESYHIYIINLLTKTHTVAKLWVFENDRLFSTS